MIRFDRMPSHPWRLAAPRALPSGALVVEMALAYPGVRGPYPDGALVYTPADVLSDEAWLTSLAGVPLVEDDQETHAEGAGLDEPTRIGTILSARWDPDQTAPDASEPGVVIAEAVIDTERGIAGVQGGRVGVSPAYDSDAPEDAGSAPNGMRYTHREVARSRGDNVAITYTPRGRSAAIRADAGQPMTPEQIAALVAALKDALLPELAVALKPPMDADAADAEGEDKSEAKPSGPTVADMRRVLDAAGAGGVDLKDDMTYDAAVQAVGGATLGRADATPDECRAAIVVAAKLRADAEAARKSGRSQWSGQGVPGRSDSTATVDASGVPII